MPVAPMLLYCILFDALGHVQLNAQDNFIFYSLRKISQLTDVLKMKILLKIHLLVKYFIKKNNHSLY